MRQRASAHPTSLEPGGCSAALMPFGAFGALAVLLRALRVFAVEKNRNAPIRPALLLVTQVDGAAVQATDGDHGVVDLVPHIGEDLEVLAEAGDDLFQPLL